MIYVITVDEFSFGVFKQKIKLAAHISFIGATRLLEIYQDDAYFDGYKKIASVGGINEHYVVTTHRKFLFFKRIIQLQAVELEND